MAPRIGWDGVALQIRTVPVGGTRWLAHQRSKALLGAGAESDLHHLSRDVFMLGDINGSLEHSTRFVLIDRASRIRGFYLTSEPDAITRLIADAKTLLRERN